ncbi:hypothetical protein IMSAG049_01737 [Clostridiales bacterium]|nr:hypothetical protein IMSAG049_01737 [Clostridiales bacterium]
MARLKEIYRCTVCGGDMQIIKFDKNARKIYYRCERCGYEETLSFDEALVGDDDYSCFILKEDGTLTWECPESGIKTENAENISDFSKYYELENLCPECKE